METAGLGPVTAPTPMGICFPAHFDEVHFHQSDMLGIFAAIKSIRTERQQNMNRLEPEERRKVEELDKDIDKLNAITLEYSEARNMYLQSNEKLCELREEEAQKVQEIADAQKKKQEALEIAKPWKQAMEDCCQRLCEQYGVFFSSPDPFREWEHLLMLKLSESEGEGRVAYLKEQLLSSLVNRKVCLKNMQVTFDQQREIIANDFFDRAPFNKEEFFPEKGETHNRGKIATRVVCSYQGKEIGKVFYKPRDATIDIAVIQLFRDINALSTDEHPLPPLPVYKISNCELSDGSKASIWEYIEGKPLGGNVDDFLQIIMDPEVKARVKASAEHLESVCLALGVSDLHGENIIERSTSPTPTSFKHEIVPVDLENLQFGKDTGMFPLAKQLPLLSDQERSLIGRCREQLIDVPVRYVPVGTSHFESALSDYRTYKGITDSIITQMTTDGYNLRVPRERLEFLILHDLGCGDVPYCVVQGKMIYWEPLHEAVAEKK